jgi:predicted oxidoreductase
MADYSADVIIAGAGLAGLATAYDLLERDKKVLVIDKDSAGAVGGLARLSFGGICMTDTPQQRRTGIKDSSELLHRDWLSYARFGDGQEYEKPRQWARFYAEESHQIYEFLDQKKIKFLPVVNWTERGLFVPGNSVPRWHVAWGTGWEIIDKLMKALECHPKRNNLQLVFDHEVNEIDFEGGEVVGVSGRKMNDGADYSARGEATIIASGGICGGDMSFLRENWFKDWGKPPKKMLNGAHPYGDGMLHKAAQKHGAWLTHLDKHWHYAQGVHKPGNQRPDDGVSTTPPRSGLWMDSSGRRVGPVPLMGYADTRWAVEQICKMPGQYSWMIMNDKIALKELAVSGCDYMTSFRYKKRLKMAKELLFGNRELVDRMVNEHDEDFIIANSVDELADKMQEKQLFGIEIDKEGMKSDIRAYDETIARGEKYMWDLQLTRIAQYRKYRGDRIRLCKFQAIDDPAARPLIAVRSFIMARKSLGGIQTDLQCRVMQPDGQAIDGLFAVGEAAGFGGGGMHGHASLEGTFLGGCVLTARAAARAIAC